ncbi:hypothetical protein BDZ91DRAFT_776676 [Kalaharituber pfeilii]|nr:hypothetical protein BDZ91DRAFT_776676 [Kalaharituber pfeilii]
MSLFGNSPPASPRANPLFPDDVDHKGGGLGGDILRTSSQPVNVGGGGGLFDDMGDGDIWALPAPRSHTGLIKTLLTEANSNLPAAYGEMFERVMADYPAGGFAGGISPAGVKRILEEAGLDEDSGTGRRIKETIIPPGISPGVEVSVGKGEFNVLLAMVGLAQEGEDVSIDGVDDRRKNLPMPKLKTYLPMPHYSTSGQNGGFDSREAEPVPNSTTSEHNQDPMSSSNATATSSGINSATLTGSTINSTAPTTVDHTYSPSANPPVAGATKSSNMQGQTKARTRVVSNSSYTRTVMADAAEDPWGSPTLHSTHSQAHQSANKNNPFISQPSVVAGGFGQNPHGEEHEPDDLQAALRAHAVPPMGVGRSSTAAWGGFDGAVASHPPRMNTGMLGGFGGALAGDTGGFGSGGAGAGAGTGTGSGVGGGMTTPHLGSGNRLGSYGGIGGGMLGGPPQQTQSQQQRRGTGIRFEDGVTVTALPEKEGMFLFQHRNYQISSGRRGSRVVRRYSDFVWLLDCLHKRYPFRCLPLLPPKRIAVNGDPLLADSAFLENRRRGLIRFTNFLVRHPVLSQEQLVIMFLTVPTELSVWRKQANLSVVDEFTTRLQTLTPQQIREIEASLPENLEQTFETVRSGLRKSAETYIGLCTLVERLGKRQEGVASELARFATALDSLTDVSEATYAVDTGDIPGMNEGLSCVARYLGNAQTLMIDEARGWEEGLLEDLKRQRDGLVAMREMFERRERMKDDQVPALEKRIKAAEKRMEVAAELAKLQAQIAKDKQSIVEAMARRVLIKECLRDELHTFHSSQYHVARMHQDWSMERVKYAELMADNWRGLQGGWRGCRWGKEAGAGRGMWGGGCGVGGVLG